MAEAEDYIPAKTNVNDYLVGDSKWIVAIAGRYGLFWRKTSKQSTKSDETTLTLFDAVSGGAKNSPTNFSVHARLRFELTLCGSAAKQSCC